MLVFVVPKMFQSSPSLAPFFVQRYINNGDVLPNRFSPWWAWCLQHGVSGRSR